MLKYFDIRKRYGLPHAEPKDLLEIQTKSFQDFLQKEAPPVERKSQGLQHLFKSFFPVRCISGKSAVEFVSYSVDEARHTPDKCRVKKLTYEAKVSANLRIVIYDGERVSEIREQSIPLFDLPMMTADGAFIVNGIEKVVLNQIVRAPGAAITRNKEKHYAAKILPDYGAWISYEFNKQHPIFSRIDLSPPVSLLTLFRAFGVSDEEISRYFPDILSETNELSPEFNNLHDKYRTDYPDDDTPSRVLAARFELLKKIKKDVAPTIPTANFFFSRLLRSPRRYDLSAIGRINLNKKTGLKIPEDMTVLDSREVMIIAKKLQELKEEDCDADNIDSLENKIIKPVGRQLVEYIRKGLLTMERGIYETLFQADLKALMPDHVIRPGYIRGAISLFFTQNPLCQFAHQTNILADISQKRRISADGPGGIDRDSATLEARDIQPTQYARICPIESPEGKNIGLVSSLASHARVNSMGTLAAPYYVVRNGEVTDRIKYLLPDEEKKHVITDFNALDEQAGMKLKEGMVLARRFVTRGKDGPSGIEVLPTPREDVDLIDISPTQLMSPATALVPFVQHCDAHRALMGASMQKQAVPLVRGGAPLIGTGMERVIARSSTYVIFSKYDGVVEAVDSSRILVKRLRESTAVDSYRLKKFRLSNQGTCINQKPVVKAGEKVKKGDLLVDGHAVSNGELALGKDVLVAYMSWYGFGYEDSIIISERLLKDDAFSSIHMNTFEIDELKTRLGSEMVTRDVPGASHHALANLDDNGIVKAGSHVKPGDIVVGKVTPKGEDISPEEALLRAIFGNKISQVKDASLVVPPGAGGVVVDVQILDRKQGELPNDVIKRIMITIAQNRKIEVGDKMAGRYGNKGVVSKILPVEDMPFMEDGTPVDIILNPLGVPSRMNVGQLLETQFGMASWKLGQKISFMAEDGSTIEELRSVLKTIYDSEKQQKDIDAMSPEELKDFAKKLGDGIPVATPVFAGATEQDIVNMMQKAGLSTGLYRVYDGKTGEPFDSEILVGKQYMMKLHHLVEDKIHARSVGPYSAITQQPLKGRANFGGQRMGEMEVWALEGYGAAYNLLEMTTIKSDDIEGRGEVFDEIRRNGRYHLGGARTEALNVLLKELQGLCLDVDFVKRTEKSADKSIKSEKQKK